MKTKMITEPQINRIRLDAAKAGFDDPQDAVDQIRGISSRNWRYDLTSMDASAVITALNEGLTPPPAPAMTEPVTTDGGLDAATAVSMLGRRVTVTTDAGKTFVGEVNSIQRSTRDGSPALYIYRASGGPASVRLSRVVSWSIEEKRP